MVYIEEVTEDEALDLKEKGNAAFKRQDFAEAERLFTEALQLASETAIRAVLLANRSFARMKLARPALALEDAQEAVRLDSKNTKAAFRKGRCELLLGLYDSAAATFKELEQAGCLNDEVSKQIENLNARRREQTSGEYDFAWLYSLPAGSLTECARYVGPIAVSDCGDRGRGVVVTRDVRAGELLFADKAFCIEKRAKLAEATVRKLRECPKHQFDAFWALSDGTTVPSIAAAADLLSTRAQRGAENPSGRKVDMDRVRKVLDCNAHAAGTMDIKTGVADESDTSGLFPLGSLVNHSCRPSATRVFLGDLLICRAARDLASGEEVTDSYVSVLQPAFARRSALLDHSGFSIADARSVVEDWCLPQSLAKPLRDRSDKISAEVTAATLGRAVSAFAALAAEWSSSARSAPASPARRRPCARQRGALARLRSARGCCAETSCRCSLASPSRRASLAGGKPPQRRIGAAAASRRKMRRIAHTTRLGLGSCSTPCGSTRAMALPSRMPHIVAACSASTSALGSSTLWPPRPG